VVGTVIYRSVRLGEIPSLLVTTATSSGMVLFLLAAAGPFSWLVAESQVASAVTAFIHSLSDNPVVILLIINGVLLLIGCIIEPLPAMIIFIPTLLPLAAQLGIDPIQFGSVIVLNLMIGMLHPPIGLLLFVVASIGNLPIKRVMIESLPFLAWAITVLVLCIVFPPITTWLPSQIK
jgi:tripartite ATP-independent transporter DctM subunit